jgi:hypothetical protein
MNLAARKVAHELMATNWQTSESALAFLRSRGMAEAAISRIRSDLFPKANNDRARIDLLNRLAACQFLS